MTPPSYVKFPIISGALKDKASIAIWTTTPWTLPANLAHRGASERNLRRPGIHRPQDGGTSASRTETSFSPINSFRNFVPPPVSNRPANRCNLFPATNSKASARNIPFCRALPWSCRPSFVTMDTGTGAVHIAPGHGEDDYVLGSKNSFPILSPVDDHGRYTNEVGIAELVGKYVFDANADIVRIACASAGCSWPNKIFIIAIPIAGARKRRSSFAQSNNSLSASMRSAREALDAIHIK
jgi:isoleucyl-tRNA synthetase